MNEAVLIDRIVDLADDLVDEALMYEFGIHRCLQEAARELKNAIQLYKAFMREKMEGEKDDGGS